MATASYSRIKYPKGVNVLLTAHVVFESVALNFGWVINIDSNNIYHRGALYPIYILMFSASTLYCIVKVLQTDMRHYSKPSIILVATLAFLVLGVGLQMIDSDIRTDYMCVAISNYFLYNHRCKMILQLNGLTYLLNRRCYEKDIEKIDPPAVIILMDVNNFKKLNDTYGHIAGDHYLREIASIIQSTYGRFGTCYRYGGDEFCVIMTKNVDRVEEKIKAFKDKIKEKQITDDRLPDVSIGFSNYSDNGTHIRQVIELADKLMYSNKMQQKV